MHTPISSISGIDWPAIPNNEAAKMLSVLQQLNESQWYDKNKLDTLQQQQLLNVIRHAYQTVPFYKNNFNRLKINPKTQSIHTVLKKLPILKRADVQAAGSKLISKALPKAHGQSIEIETSGSTGRPIRILSTELTNFFWQCFTVREHLWKKRNFTEKLASIRHFKRGTAELPDGLHIMGWGSALDKLFETGSSAGLRIQSEISKQADWLVNEAPDYLLSYPSNIMALANYFKSNNLKLPNLKEVRTMGEALGEDLRKVVKSTWDVPLTDIYTAQETGYIALQCPENNHYHIQSENVYVEILDEKNNPCSPGETGRIVITTLHNFATPLIRYEIGDYAEVGETCSCGRGLPVLNKILGRTRNMLHLPNGETIWPAFGPKKFNVVAPVNQLQLIQKKINDIQVNLATPRPLTKEEEKDISKIITDRLGDHIQLDFKYYDEIPRSKSGKYEEFKSNLTL